MSEIHAVTRAILAIIAIGSMDIARASDVDVNLRADLELIAQQRIFFGHQSVGVNLLEGVKQLAASASVPIRIVETTSTSEVKPATIGHTFIARNGDPFQKLKSFEQAFGQQPANIDIALMKFCFVDFSANTDAIALFNQYRTTIDALKAKNPHTVFVHVTAPLTGKTGGVKGLAKQILGRDGSAENIRREEYNNLMRNTYLGHEPLFDLARIESIAPNGEKVTVKYGGLTTPAMAPEYTNDGGHLNNLGSMRAARELVSVLASIPAKPVSAH
jgi:hypothetical protein